MSSQAERCVCQTWRDNGKAGCNPRCYVCKWTGRPADAPCVLTMEAGS